MSTETFNRLFTSTVPASAPYYAEVTRRHFTGESNLDPVVLLNMYRAEITKETPFRSRYVDFARVYVDAMAADMVKKLDKLYKRGGHETLMVATPRTAYDVNTYQPRRIAEVRAKLPRVSERVRNGDVVMFANMLGAVHIFGACVGCGRNGQFTMGTTARQFKPFDIALPVPSDQQDNSRVICQMIGKPQTWNNILGYCGGGNECSHACNNCGANTPASFDFRWVTSLRTDQLCWPCAMKQLVNLERPTRSRADWRRASFNI